MENEFLIKRKISVIVPVWNEEKYLPVLLEALDTSLKSDPNLEVLVVDGGSTDRTRKIAANYGVKLLRSEIRSRSAQCNLGAISAAGDILFFLHADCLPPFDFPDRIRTNTDRKIRSGCFRIRYESGNLWLRWNAKYKDWDWNLLRFGDQGLFMEASLFRECGGYKKEWKVMEDAEIVRRIRKLASFKVLDSSITVSPRKFYEIGTIRLQFSYLVCSFLFLAGMGPECLEKAYRILVGSEKKSARFH